MTHDGEVSVRQNGQETAIGATDLDGEIHVDLDGEYPRLRIPSRVEVGYWDEDEGTEHDVATDGGAAERREVEMRGFGLDEDYAMLGIGLSVLSLVSSGHLWGTELGAAFILLAGGLLLGYVSVRSYWSGRT